MVDGKIVGQNYMQKGINGMLKILKYIKNKLKGIKLYQLTYPLPE